MCLLLGLKEYEAKALAVNRVEPVATEEAFGGLDPRQDFVRERIRHGRRLYGINRQLYKCCIHSLTPFIHYLQTLSPTMPAACAALNVSPPTRPLPCPTRATVD